MMSTSTLKGVLCEGCSIYCSKDNEVKLMYADLVEMRTDSVPVDTGQEDIPRPITPIHSKTERERKSRLVPGVRKMTQKGYTLGLIPGIHTVTHSKLRDLNKAEHSATLATSSTNKGEEKTSLGISKEDMLFLAAMGASSKMMKEEQKQKEMLRENEKELELSRRTVKHLTYCLMESMRETRDEEFVPGRLKKN